jgi:hypothetical protein
MAASPFITSKFKGLRPAVTQVTHDFPLSKGKEKEDP